MSEHRGLTVAAPSNINLESRGRGGGRSSGDAIDFPGGGPAPLVAGAPPKRAPEQRGAAVVDDIEGRGGRGKPRGRGGDVGGLPRCRIVPVEPQREGDGGVLALAVGVAARGTEIEREAWWWGRAAVWGDAHVEETDLEVRHPRRAWWPCYFVRVERPPWKEDFLVELLTKVEAISDES